MVENLRNNHYKMKTKTIDHLKKNRFKCVDSYDGSEIWKYRFSALEQNKKTTLIGEILVRTDTWDVDINVVDASGAIYPPYFNGFESHSFLIKLVNERFKIEFNKLNIEEKR